MRRFIKFEDGQEVELSPISFDEFQAIDIWVGTDDMEFKKWLNHNGYVEASDYRRDALETASYRVSLEAIDPERFEFSDNGGETWEPLDVSKSYSNRTYRLYHEEW